MYWKTGRQMSIDRQTHWALETQNWFIRATGMASRPLQFAPFISVVDTGFWHELTRRKLEVYQLDDSPQPLQGSYTNGHVMLPNSWTMLAHYCLRWLRSSSGHSRSSLAHGTLVITNTMEDFKMADKAHLITESGRKVWHTEERNG
jgi:hypothetical protein